MIAAKSFENIVQQIRSSNLNYKLQLSPFSANISLKKTPVKDMSGAPLILPCIYTTENIIKLEAEISKLKHEVYNLKNDLANSVVEVQAAQEIIENIQAKSEKDAHVNRELLDSKHLISNLHAKIADLVNENKQYRIRVKDLEIEIKVSKEQVANIDKHKAEIIALRNDCDNIRNRNIQLKEQLEEKDDELRDAIIEKEKFDEKINSLLDMLYCCHECGLHRCECNGHNDSVEEDDSFLGQMGNKFPELFSSTSQPSPPSVPSESPAARLLHSPPWTPHQTPPCISCRGLNFGPSPSSLCFNCISPLQSISEPYSSKSPPRTPPGTPPLHRLEIGSNKSHLGENSNDMRA